MQRATIRLAAVALLSAVIPFAGAAAYVALNGGFGAGDLPAFAIWCGLLALVVAGLAAAVARAGLPASRPKRMLCGLGLGVAVGPAYTVAVALGMGGWIGAFSFPVLYLWTAGAVAGLGTALPLTPPVARPGSDGRALMRAGGVLVASLLGVALLPVVLAFGSAYIWDRAEREVHLLPAGFRGPVVVVFDQPMGAPRRYEDGARLYVVPRNGVLRTQFAVNNGWSRPAYYYVDAVGRRTRIVAGAPCEDSLPLDPVQACLMGRLYLGDRTGPDYDAYVVGRRAERRAQYDRGDSLVRVAVFGDSIPSAP